MGSAAYQDRHPETNALHFRSGPVNNGLWERGASGGIICDAALLKEIPTARLSNNSFFNLEKGHDSSMRKPRTRPKGVGLRQLRCREMGIFGTDDVNGVCQHI
jgi:hypothetical protein